MKSKLIEDSNISSHATALITLPELAFLLRKSRSAVHKAWPKWAKNWGLEPIRFGGSRKGRLLFNREDVDQMIKKWAVSETEKYFGDNKTSGRFSTQKRLHKDK